MGLDERMAEQKSDVDCGSLSEVYRLRRKRITTVGDAEEDYVI